MSYSKMFCEVPVYTPAEIQEILTMRYCGSKDIDILKAIHAARQAGAPGYGVAEKELNYNSVTLRKVAGEVPRTKADLLRLESAIRRQESNEARELREIEKGIAKLEKAEQRKANRPAKVKTFDVSKLTPEQKEKLIREKRAELAALYGEPESVDVSGKVFDK
jgi:hypothetical protein